jgi:transposase
LGLKISYQTLSEFYKRLKVRYVKPQYAYCRKMLRQQEIGDEQQKTVMLIS